MRKNILFFIFRAFYLVVSKNYFNFYKNQFKKKNIKNKEEYLNVFEKTKKIECETILKYLNQFENNIEEDFVNKLALITQVTIKKSHVQYFHGKILYAVLANILKKRNLNYINVLEIGTARGFSSICMAKALNDFKLNGSIITLDILPHNTNMYWGCIEDNNGKQTRKKLLQNYNDLLNYISFIQMESPYDLTRIGINNINLCFIDGKHTYESVIKESVYVNNYQLKDDIIVFDDYNDTIFPGSVKAIDKFCKEYKYNKLVIEGYQDRGFVVATKL